MLQCICLPNASSTALGHSFRGVLLFLEKQNLRRGLLPIRSGK